MSKKVNEVSNTFSVMSGTPAYAPRVRAVRYRPHRTEHLIVASSIIAITAPILSAIAAYTL